MDEWSFDLGELGAEVANLPNLAGYDVALDDGFSFDIGNIASELQNLGGLDLGGFNAALDDGYSFDISSLANELANIDGLANFGVADDLFGVNPDVVLQDYGFGGGDLGGFADLEEASRQARLAEYGVQDLGPTMSPTDEQGRLQLSGYDEGRLPSQWQKVGDSDLRVMIQDDGSGIGINPATGTHFGLEREQVQNLVKEGLLNTYKSGYFTATGGSKVAPGGGITTKTKDGTNVVVKPDGKIYDTDTGKVVTDTKTIKEIIEKIRETGGTGGVSTKPGLQQQNMLSSLLPLLLMMLAMNRGGGSSGQGSSAVIPGLTATQKQTPYTQLQQAPGYRPGQGGITYFNPVQYAPRMASGGIVTLAEGGGLSKDSTAQEIADAYKSYIDTAGGDRPETQAAAVNFLRDLGIGDETIMSGYQTFLGNPPASTAANTAATTTEPPTDYATQILEKKLAELAPAAYQEKGSVPYRVRELIEDALKGIMPESEADKELLNRQLYSSTTLRDAASKLGYDYDKEGIGSLLTNVNFNQRDPRNWIEIFRAADPIAAARAATGQAIMGGAFSNADPRERAYQGSPVARSGNVGLFEVSTPSGTYLQPRFLTPEGLIKGNAYTSSDIGGFTTGARNLGLGVTQADIDALKAKAAAYYAGTSKPRGYDAEASMSFLNNLKPISAGYAGSTPNYLIPGMNPSIYSGVEWSPNAARAPGMAGGGIIDLARALAAKRREQRQGLLKGRGDGVSDSIPAMIGRDQPARLARGEYVVDARTVAELGNGSTDAGAERLDEMRKRVHAKRKKAKVGEDSGAHKVLPA